MIDWSDCSLVVCRHEYVSGAPALRDDPRVMVDVVVENMDLGESAEDVIENYALRTSVHDVLEIYAYAKRQRVQDPV